ncbi:penicillin-binding transpeptidase domain-containing protein [Margalitia sp. FSL K6-0131]|uniref:penicillin-binding transpeptidase domain-containing protein n=1 Tax=Margalitia sp. FSL K6-0131 TaxID=2954604 RepID=UPI004046A279
MKKISFIAVMLLVAIGLLSACQKEASPNERLKDYVKLWDKGDFNKMYNDFLSSSTKKEFKTADFVDRYPKIYKDLEVKNLKITYKSLKEDSYKKKDKVAIPVNISFETFAGPVQYSTKIALTKEEKNKQESWYVDWKPELLLPGLAKGDKIVPATVDPKRGEIRDRNGQGLAVNGTAYQIGVIPEKMAGQETEVKNQLAKLLGMSVQEIDQKLNASWVKPNLFVPIKKIATNNEEILAKLYKLPGVDKQDTSARVYPFGKATAHLVGYIGPINAEELKEEKGKGYSANSVIGKRGLEQLYEERLRGTAGEKITIQKADGTQKVVAEKEVQNGENIEVTIDANLQEKIYNQFKGSAGTAAAIQPTTGEVLSLVSSPSFDPNDFVLGMPGSEYSKLEKDPLQPLINRFALSYAPGSSIKPITAAIALENGTLKPNSTKTINGKSWGKGGSWGDYQVSRVHVENGPVSLSDAMMYSDNIFFAQTALDMGGDKFAKGLKNFGFTEQLPIEYPLKKSQISSDGKLDHEILLADSGYGQGQVQMNILHLADTYTTFVNNGNMIKPNLLLSEKKSQVWKENVISPDTAKTVAGLLRKVVADPRGTGHGADLPNVALAGKTGTAELKSSKKEKGKENGLFVAYDQNKKDLLVAVMVEGVEKGGGSHLVVQKVANIFK